MSDGQNDTPYVNWEVAPKGCNAVFAYHEGSITPSANSSCWEKWANGDVYDWNGGDGWLYYGTEEGLDKAARIFRPKESTEGDYKPTAQELDAVIDAIYPSVSKPKPDYSKMPEGDKVWRRSRYVSSTCLY